MLASEATGRGKKQINVIFMFLQGGASHIDMYDMKPHAPAEIRGKYNPASSNIPGVQLSDQLPKLLACADKFSMIRSMHSYTSKHGEGDVHIMSGSPVDKNLQSPGIGAVPQPAAATAGLDPPICAHGRHEAPAYSAPGFGGFLGQKHNPFPDQAEPEFPGVSLSGHLIRPKMSIPVAWLVAAACCGHLTATRPSRKGNWISPVPTTRSPSGHSNCRLREKPNRRSTCHANRPEFVMPMDATGLGREC